MKIGVLALQGDFALHTKALAPLSGRRGRWRCESPNSSTISTASSSRAARARRLLKLMDAVGLRAGAGEVPRRRQAHVRDLRGPDPHGA